MNSPNKELISEVTRQNLDLVAGRIAHNEDAMRYAMNQTLYGDQRMHMPPPTRWQSLRWRWTCRARRVRDAWLVLIGKANIE
jgi:hypothetical protein